MKSSGLRVFVFLLSVCTGASGGSLQPVWTLDLHSVEGVAASEELPIGALRFSPDGRQVAIVAGFVKGGDGRRMSNLFVVGAKEPAAHAARLMIAASRSDSE